MKKQRLEAETKHIYLRAFHASASHCHTAGVIAAREAGRDAECIYLAGPIFGKSDSECLEWRQKATQLLDYDVLSPMARDYRGEEDANCEQIVKGDLRDIRKCAAILVNAAAPSWGTAMEVLYAAEICKIPVVAFNVQLDSCSPWVRYFCFIVSTLEEGVNAIHEKLKK